MKLKAHWAPSTIHLQDFPANTSPNTVHQQSVYNTSNAANFTLSSNNNMTIGTEIHWRFSTNNARFVYLVAAGQLPLLFLATLVDRPPRLSVPSPDEFFTQTAHQVDLWTYEVSGANLLIAAFEHKKPWPSGSSQLVTFQLTVLSPKVDPILSVQHSLRRAIISGAQHISP